MRDLLEVAKLHIALEDWPAERVFGCYPAFAAEEQGELRFFPLGQLLRLSAPIKLLDGLLLA